MAPDPAVHDAPPDLRIRAVQLPETARVTVDDEDVPVARRARASLDRGVRRDRVRAGVALVVVHERHGHPRLRAGNGRVRDADRPAVPLTGAEVRLEPGRRADARDPGRRLRVNGQRRTRPRARTSRPASSGTPVRRERACPRPARRGPARRAPAEAWLAIRGSPAPSEPMRTFRLRASPKGGAAPAQAHPFETLGRVEPVRGPPK